MRHAIFLASLLAALLTAFAARAQGAGQTYIQIEAQPTLAEAQDRARAYGGIFADVVGFQLGTGWYAIALGPDTRRAAEDRLIELKLGAMIPPDGFLVEGATYRAERQYWPDGVAAVTPLPADPPITATPIAPLAEAEPAVAPPAPSPAPVPVPGETVQQARASETQLTGQEREALQTALQWFGFYTARIDGAFGPGTRNSMVAWQSANAQEPTGVLTSRQRADLLTSWQGEVAAFGFETILEPEAGIEVTLPLSLIGFDHYEPPFVHYTEKAGSGLRVILISQPGDQAALYGLYDILQTLAVVPLDGERSRGERSFVIEGRNATTASYSYAEVSQGLIKGYMVIWEPGNATTAGRVLSTVQASFRGVGDRVLDPGLVPMADETRRGLLSGLELRAPRFSRSGFFVDGMGRVLTTAEAVAQCGRVTLDRGTEATVTLTDAAIGMALLTPKTRLAPRHFAEFQQAPDRIGAEIAVSGYSYEDALPAPVLTYGTLEDVVGLDGEPGLKRLGLSALPGDAGGPVLDATGAVLGMLLPRDTGGSRVLPEGVAFAVTGSAMEAVLAGQGITLRQGVRQGNLAPDDLNDQAAGMTVLVSCWE